MKIYTTTGLVPKITNYHLFLAASLRMIYLRKVCTQVCLYLYINILCIMYSCTKVPYSMYPYSMYPENVSGRSRDLLLVFSL